MLKKIIAVVGLSMAIILFMPYAQQAVQLLVNAHDWIAELLTEVFSGGQTGNLIRSMIALLSIPLIMGVIPAVIYWVIRRHWLPYFMEVVLIVWLVQAGALAVMYKGM